MRDAVEFFQRALRDDWSGWERPEKWEGAAPLASTFHTSFQGGAREWVRLHELARALFGLENLDAVVGRRGLGSPSWTDFYAAVMTLEICAGFRRGGRRVELVPENNDASPDARIVAARRSITTEFKALHDPEEMERWDMLYKLLIDRTCVRGLNHWSLEIYAMRPALDRPEAFIEGLIAVLERQISEPQELPEGTGVAWYRENPAMQGGWHPDVQQKDDLARLVEKLTGKWYRKVLSLEGPAIVIVRTDMLAASSRQRVEEVAEEIAQELGRELAEAVRFSAVLIYEDVMWPSPQPAFVQTATHRLALGSPDGRSYRAALLVPNPAARFPLTEEERGAFVDRQMRW
jgi:hypothetical protein